MPAAGKTVTANVIAKKLGIEAIGGGEILKEMADARGYKVTGEDWWDTPEGMKFLKERGSNPEFDKEADHRLIQKINKGNIVVTSYTAPWISKNGIKCWLEASRETRAKRMAARDGTSVEEARKVVRTRDRENFELYKKMYGLELGKDMKPFNIIVDVNTITPEQAAEEIIKQAKECEKK
jgi:cytidylate kinase